jgi:hypothetical protein
MDAIFQVLGQRVLREIKLNNGTEPTSLIVSEDEMKRIADYAHNRFGNFEYVRIAMYELHKTLTLRLTVVEVGTNKASGDGRFGYGFRAAPKRGRHAGQSDTASDFTPPNVGFDFGHVSMDEARERIFGKDAPPEPPKRPSPFKVSDEDVKRVEAHFHPSPGPAHWGVDHAAGSDHTAYTTSTDGFNFEHIVDNDPFMSDDLRKMVEEAMRRAAGLK